MKQHNMRPKVLKKECKKMFPNQKILLDVLGHVPGTFSGALMHVGTLAGAVALLSSLSAAPSHALPQNGSVVGGSATISQPNSTTMNISQTSANAIINWQGYSIGANESVRYIQPGSSSIALNRVSGVDPSHIYGLLSGNGQVWVINPNGLLVGPGATVQTGSFLASTMNITNENFMSGRYNFTNTLGSSASIINQGLIQAANGGYVVLAAPSVTNTGSIAANLGSVHLASGDAITLSIDNGNLINVAVSGDVVESALGVTNTGHITADGGQVLLTARVAGDIMKNIVNNEGIIEAKSIIEKDGIIILDGGNGGITANSGILDASGKNAGETGGKVTVVGDKVGLFAGSRVDVSGDAGGGTVLIGGNLHGAGPEKNASMTYIDNNAAIKADALVNGDGGTVVVWSNDATRFYGSISAKGGVQGGDGGNAEVSGEKYLHYAGVSDLRATLGSAGTVLLDPADIYIVNGAAGPGVNVTGSGAGPFTNAATDTNADATITDSTLTAQLATANVYLESTGGIDSASGVNVSTSGNALNLNAATFITLGGRYGGGGALGLNFMTTLDLTRGPDISGITVTATGGGTGTIKGSGLTYLLDNSAQNMGSNGTLAWTGVRNINDATGTVNFNSSGTVSGIVTVPTLDYSNWTTSAVTFDLGTGASTGTGGTSGVTSVKGKSSNASSNTIQGGSTYTLTGANAGSNGTVGWSDFGRLNASSKVDFGATGSVTGIVTAPTLDYSNWSTSAVTFNLESGASSGTGGTSSVTMIKGKSSNAAANTIQGGTTYTLVDGTPNAGSNGTVNWSDFGKLNASSKVNFGATGSVTGIVTAPMLDYSSWSTSAVTFDLGSGASSGTGGTSGVTSVKGKSSNAAANTIQGGTLYTLTGANAGSNGTVSWSDFGRLNASSKVDFGATGSVTGIVTAPMLDYSNWTTSAVTFDLGSGASSGTGGTSGVTMVKGKSSNAAANTIQGGTTYTLVDGTPNAGSNGTVSWSDFGRLNAGSKVDFGATGTVTGVVTAPTLDYSSYGSDVTVALTGAMTGAATGIGGSFNGVSAINANPIRNNSMSGTGQTYNLTAPDAGNGGGVSWTSFDKIADIGTGTITTTGGRTYTLTGANSGNVAALLPGGFTGIGNLAESGAGIFKFAAGGSVTGSITAAGGTLDYSAGISGPVTVDLKAKSGSGIGGGWDGITAVTGSAASDTMGGTNATYNLTAANAGNSGGVSWSSFENLHDTAAGTFRFAAGGSVTGGIRAVGGMLDYSGIAGPVTVDLTAKSGSGIGGGWDGITAVAGSAASDTMGGTHATYNLTSANAGNSGGVSWSSFEKITDTGTGTIATTGGQTYNMTGVNAGNVAALLPGGYTGIGNLADSGAGIFRFAAGGAVTGGIRAAGGTLDYSAIADPVTVDLTTKSGSGLGGGWDGITAVTGSAASDTMGGTDATYNLTGVNAGNSGGVSWSSFEKIADNGVGTIATTSGRTYTLTGANTGNVAGLLPGGYSGIGNLADSGAGLFTFAAGGSVTGSITAAGGTLDYSGSAGPVAVDLTAKTGSGIGGGWDGITSVTGSAASDTMGGANAAYNLTALDAGNSGGITWSSFENLHDTAAGIFRFAAAGAVTGGITAAGGTLDYSGLTGPVTVDLTAKTGPGIGSSWNGIAMMTGSASGSDTITGSSQTFNLTGDNSGNNGGVSWTSFENINGLTGTNSYFGSGGSLSGAIVDAGSSATLRGNIQTGGDQTYNGAVTLNAATTLTSTDAGAITFAGTLDSAPTPRDLMIATSGVTTFSGAVGSRPLNSLTIDGGTTDINGGSVTTSGAGGQLYNSAVVLGGNTSLNADSGAITLGSKGSLAAAGLLSTRSSSGQTLVGNGTSRVATFSATNSSSGDINLTNSATPLTIAGISQTGGSLIITNSGEISSSAPLTVSGATNITAAGRPITLTNANNDFSGTLTVAGAATRITDRNNLAVVLNTTGPTTVAAGADMNLSGISTDSVTATAAGTVTLSNPVASILHITGATIVGTMSNSTPLDLVTTAQTPITVNLTGSLPFLTFAGDVRTNIRSLGLYNGAVVMGSEMDHFKSMIDLRAATTALAADTEQSETVGKLARFDEFFEAIPRESIMDSRDTFNTPEAEPTLIDF